MTPERWERVRDVLGQVLELPPEKRDRFLDNVRCNRSDLADPVERSFHTSSAFVAVTSL